MMMPTAESSRLHRVKKKQERDMLLEENKDLRKEQAFYAMQISELERLQQAHYKAELARENQLLRDELALHQKFLSEVFVQLDKTEPRAGALMRELSKQSREMNMLRAMRILADSQCNLRRNWHQVDLQCDFMQNARSKLHNATMRYAVCANENLEIRADVWFSGELSPTQLHEAMTVNWCAKRCFNTDFEENHVVASDELEDFRVDEANEVLQAFYRKVKMRGTEPNHPRFREAIILMAKGTTSMIRSTLDVDDHNTTDCQEIAKRMRTSETPTAVGLTECDFAFRSSTNQASFPEIDDKTTERVLCTVFEGMFSWRDHDQTRMTWLMSVPLAVTSSYHVAIADYFSEDGTCKADSTLSMAFNFLTTKYLSHLIG